MIFHADRWMGMKAETAGPWVDVEVEPCFASGFVYEPAVYWIIIDTSGMLLQLICNTDKQIILQVYPCYKLYHLVSQLPWYEFHGLSLESSCECWISEYLVLLLP